PWDERLSFDDDGEYFCRVLLRSEGVRFVRGSRAYYRTTGPGSLSSVDYSDKKLDSAWLSLRLHIQYLLQLENSPRTRDASVSFLQTWLSIFDPHRTDIIAEMQHHARMLGGEVRYLNLFEPLRRKFAWMERFFGRRFAYWAQRRLPRLKHFVIRHWDRTLFQLGY
ncbi:MAG: hypothetical protein ACRED1_08575, partial [Limisphaerales bacterium]